MVAGPGGDRGPLHGRNDPADWIGKGEPKMGWIVEEYTMAGRWRTTHPTKDAAREYLSLRGWKFGSHGPNQAETWFEWSAEAFITKASAAQPVVVGL